jgi:hypothetical protein
MLVTETTDGFWATIDALQSLGESKRVSFHTFSLPEDQCIRLLSKNLGNCMPEAETKEELKALHINVRLHCNSGRSAGVRTPRRTFP